MIVFAVWLVLFAIVLVGTALICWMLLTKDKEIPMAAMTATQASQAGATLAQCGCPQASVQGILDWFTQLGISFDDVMKIVNAALAAFSGGVTWAKIWALIQTIISIVHPAPTPPPVVVP